MYSKTKNKNIFNCLRDVQQQKQNNNRKLKTHFQQRTCLNNGFIVSLRQIELVLYAKTNILVLYTYCSFCGFNTICNLISSDYNSRGSNSAGNTGTEANFGDLVLTVDVNDVNDNNPVFATTSKCKAMSANAAGCKYTYCFI